MKSAINCIRVTNNRRPVKQWKRKLKIGMKGEEQNLTATKVATGDVQSLFVVHAVTVSSRCRSVFYEASPEQAATWSWKHWASERFDSSGCDLGRVTSQLPASCSCYGLVPGCQGPTWRDSWWTAPQRTAVCCAVLASGSVSVSPWMSRTPEYRHLTAPDLIHRNRTIWWMLLNMFWWEGQMTVLFYSYVGWRKVWHIPVYNGLMHLLEVWNKTLSDISSEQLQIPFSMFALS